MTTVESIRADLLAHGYVEVESHTDRFGERRVGQRVHHRGEQFVEAYVHGSAVIRAIFYKADSAWTRQYRDDDVEMAVEFDKGTWRKGDVTQLAQYHTAIPTGPVVPEYHRCDWCEEATSA